MATSDMYKNSYTGKDNYIYLNDSISASKYPGAKIYVDGTTYTSDNFEWEPVTNKKKIAMLRFGQSNERGSVYQNLIYTTSSIVGNGTIATVTTTIANDLIDGETYYGNITGAVPTDFNVTSVLFTVSGGTFPNKTLTFPSTYTGSATTQGTLILDVVKSVPQAFKSLVKPSVTAPVFPAKTPNGSMDFRIIDKMHSKYFVDIVPINSCVGSLSFVKQAAGQIEYWNASSQYINARASTGGDDRGDTGSLTVQNNCLYQCISGGANRYAVYNAGPRIEDTSYRELDYVITYVASGTGLSGATAPIWSNASTVGSTIVDGALTWKCIAINVTTNSASAIKNLSNGEVCFEGRLGFDPLGLLKRSSEAGSRAAADCDSKVVIISNGQSDTAATAAWYSTALNSIASFFSTRGWVVGIGLTCFNPNSTTTVYDTILKTGRTNVLSTLASNPLIFAGPDLYTGLGSTHGANGLYLQSDNAHVNENIHLSARGIIAAADVYVDWLGNMVTNKSI